MQIAIIIKVLKYLKYFDYEPSSTFSEMMTDILILVFRPQIQGQGFLEVTLMVWGG